MRAQKYVLLPDEDAAEFQALEAALVEELAPVGGCNSCSRAASRWSPGASPESTAWRSSWRWEDAGVGMALIRDGNGTRWFETLLRYRGAAMAEFWRALKALQAEPADDIGATLAHAIRQGQRAHLPRPNEPEHLAAPDLDHEPSEPLPPGALDEPATPWLPNGPETGRARHAAAPASARPQAAPELAPTRCAAPGVPQSRTNPSRSESWEGDERHGK